jgi:hypothetical protein
MAETETETETMENSKSNEIKRQISWISFICFLKSFNGEDLANVRKKETLSNRD